MKAKNQLVVLSGILVLLATATVAASNIVQPANADKPANTPNAYGKEQIARNCTNRKPWRRFVSSCAQGNYCGVGNASTHNGIAEFRANGDKFPEGTTMAKAVQTSVHKKN